MNTQVIDLINIDLEDSTNNLLLNMTGGLLPEHLQPDEIVQLKTRFGANWFNELGYFEENGYVNPEAKK